MVSPDASVPSIASAACYEASALALSGRRQLCKYVRWLLLLLLLHRWMLLLSLLAAVTSNLTGSIGPGHTVMLPSSLEAEPLLMLSSSSSLMASWW